MPHILNKESCDTSFLNKESLFLESQPPYVDYPLENSAGYSELQIMADMTIGIGTRSHPATVD